MIAKKKDFHNKWETLQNKLGAILTSAYHGSDEDFRDAINSAGNTLEQLKALTVKTEE